MPDYYLCIAGTYVNVYSIDQYYLQSNHPVPTTVIISNGTETEHYGDFIDLITDKLTELRKKEKEEETTNRVVVKGFQQPPGK